MCFLFFYSTDAVLLLFFFSGLWSMVGSGSRMPPGLSVMYEFVSFSFCGVFLFCFFCFFVEADLSHLSQSSQKLKNTEVRAKGEKHTNKDCLFVYSKKKKRAESEISSVEMWINSHLMVFFFPSKGQDDCVSRTSLHLGLYFFYFFARSIFLWRRGLVTVSIELCQSKHEIIQMKSPSPIFSCFSLSDVTANLTCWQHGDWIAW